MVHNNQINYAFRAVLNCGDVWESWSIKGPLFFFYLSECDMFLHSCGLQICFSFTALQLHLVIHEMKLCCVYEYIHSTTWYFPPYLYLALLIIMLARTPASDAFRLFDGHHSANSAVANMYCFSY